MYWKLLNYVGSLVHSSFEEKKLKRVKFWLFVGKLLGGGSNTWTLDYEALCAWEVGDLEKAVRKSHQILALDPKDIRAKQRIALCLAELGNWDDAIEFANKLVLAGQPARSFPYRLGAVLLESGADPNLAFPWFERARQDEEFREWATLNQALCFLRSKNPERAWQTYQVLWESAEDSIVKFQAGIGVAQALHDLGKLPDALKVAKETMKSETSLALRPEDLNHGKEVVAWLKKEMKLKGK